MRSIRNHMIPALLLALLCAGSAQAITPMLRELEDAFIRIGEQVRPAVVNVESEQDEKKRWATQADARRGSRISSSTMAFRCLTPKASLAVGRVRLHRVPVSYSTRAVTLSRTIT